jgi:uncharacterized protein
MRWRGRRQSSNIDDRRGRGGGSPFGRGGGFRLPTGLPGGMGRRPGGGGGMRGGGIGIGTIVLLIFAFFVLRAMGIDPLAMMAGDGGLQPRIEQSGPSTDGLAAGQEDEQAQFIATVLAETEDVWNGIMQSQGVEYPEPTLVLYNDAVASACGNAGSSSGPFYCPADNQIYIDLTFFDELARRFNAAGDFAQAYVVAHEVGHHVQNVIGILPQFNEARQRMGAAEANQASIRVELQADCFAGIWGHYTEQRGLLESGDLEEALNAATQIGDDTIQRRTQGYIVPESFSHGTAEQRRTWFQRGFESGQLAACDTFNNPI